MAFDEGLAQRVSEALDSIPNIEDKKMFGGVGYLLNGNMACGVHTDYLIVRVGPDKHTEARKDPHTKEFDLTGRAMKGWITVQAEGFQEDDDLRKWIMRGVDFAKSLPPK